MTRRKNAHYHVPGLVVRFGYVLDVQLERSQNRIMLTEWAGWHMVVTEGAFEASPGRARLYLLEGQLGAYLDETGLERAVETFDRWHHREPSSVRELDVPSEIGWYQGRARRIGYRSDKWSTEGAFVDYDHDFGEGGRPLPKVFTDRFELGDSTAALIVGGDMCITEEGID